MFHIYLIYVLYLLYICFIFTLYMFHIYLIYVSYLFDICFGFISYMFCNYSMTPYQCSGRSPALDCRKKGWMDRFRLETYFHLIDYVYNAGLYLDRPSFNIGIMPLELNNKIQNAMKLGKSRHDIQTATYETEIAQAILNFVTYGFHTRQHALPSRKRQFPKNKTHKEENPELFTVLDAIYSGLLNGSLFEHELHENEYKKYLLMPTTTINKLLPSIVYDKMVENNLKFNKEEDWTERHNMALIALIKRHNMKGVTVENINTLVEAFTNAKCHKELVKRNILKDKLFHAINKIKRKN